MAGWLTWLCVFAASFTASNAELSEAGKYFVTAPTVAQPGSEYRVTAYVTDAPGDVTFSAYIRRGTNRYSDNWVPVSNVAVKTVSPRNMVTLTLNVPSNVTTSPAVYQLHIRGTGGLQIEETHAVTMETEIASVFIQPAKKEYFQGETVTFKTFALRKADQTPYTGDYNITLHAPFDFLTQDWPASGPAVRTFHYQLDSNTPVGTWTVVAHGVNTGTTSTSFEVIPRLKSTSQDSLIDVKVHLPKTMNSSTALHGSLDASYPGGVAVKGTARIVLTGSYGINEQQVIQFHGNASFMFPYDVMVGHVMHVDVSVTEDDTGSLASGAASVRVYDRDVKIEFTERTPAVFKPRLPFTAHVKISDHADQPLHTPADSVYSTVHVRGVGHYSRPAPHGSHFGVSQFSGSYPILSTQLTLPDSGLFSLDLDIPDDVTSIDIMVTFQGVQKRLSLSQAQHSDSENYLQLFLLGPTPAVTDTQSGEARFLVLSSKPMDDLTVELICRGQVVATNQPVLTSKSTSGDAHSAEFTLTLTWEMTPATEVIAYHIVESGHLIQEVVTDSLTLDVQGLLQNRIDVTASQQHVQPGHTVSLQVQARPLSSVGVLVEESSGPSSSGFTRKAIISAIDGATAGPVEPRGAASTTQRFGEAAFPAAGVLIMDGKGRNYFGSQTAPVRQTTLADDTTTGEGATTLFFDTNTTGSDGQAWFSVSLPDTVSTWAVTAFAFDAAGHVGVADRPLLIEAGYEVYGEVTGPDHVVYGEDVVLEVRVHNTRSMDSKVTVTLEPVSNVESLIVSGAGHIQTSTGEQQQNITVAAKATKQAFFAVRSVNGLSALSVTACLNLTILSGPSKQRQTHCYTVLPGGVEQMASSSELVDVNGHVTHDLSITVPKEALPRTTTRRVAVTDEFSDLVVGPLLAGMETMEAGTGPAALLHLALPVLAARHRPHLRDRLAALMATGYQRLMNFWTGSAFSVYSTGDGTTDFWLDITAMSVLAEAGDYVPVNEDLIGSLLDRHFSHYQRSSSLLNAGIQGDVPTAELFSTLALKDLANHTALHDAWRDSQVARYNVVLGKVPAVIGGNYSDVTDPLTLSYLALASVTYGYTDVAQAALTRLMTLRNGSDATSDEIFWSTKDSDSLNYFGDWSSSRHVYESRDIVTAANALRVLVNMTRTDEADRVAKWLMRRRSGSGMFKSVWDTLAATESLLDYSSRRHHGHGHLRLNTALTGQQARQWLSQGQLANFSAAGNGKVYSQVEAKYYVTDDVRDASFEVVPVVLDESLQHFRLMVCSRWLLGSRVSGPVVQEVSAPSGFRLDVSGLGQQTHVPLYVQRSDTTVTVYFSQVGEDSSCYTLPVNRLHPVAHSAPAYILTRAVNTPENQDIVAYHPRRLKESVVCDLCPACCP